jgi:hypothetical protein
MLRNEINNWKNFREILKLMVIPKPKVLNIRDFYTEELDFLVQSSLVFKKYGKPNTITGIADCFMSSIKDIFVYALKEDEFEVLELLDKVVVCQFNIFAGYAELYLTEHNTRIEVQRTLCSMEEFYNDFKLKQLNKYGYYE